MNFPQRFIFSIIMVLSCNFYLAALEVTSPDGKYRITISGKTGTVKDLIENTDKKLVGHKDAITSVTVSPDSKYVLTGSWDKTARLWDITKDPVQLNELLGHIFPINSVTFSPDGKYALTSSIYEAARLWDLTASPITSRMLAGEGDTGRIDDKMTCIDAVSLDRSGRYAYTISSDRTTRKWDLAAHPITSEIIN